MKEIHINPFEITKEVNIGFQYDHKAYKVIFDGLEEDNYYLKLQDRATYQAFPIPDKSWTVTNTYTQQTLLTAQIFRKVDDELIAHTPKFRMSLKSSLPQSYKIKEVVPPNFQTAYDEIVETTNDIKTKLKNGEFNGQDGKSAYQIALDNGFVGSEQEWLDSLDYEHSDEFTKLANQVKEDAQKSTEAVNTVTKIKNQVENKVNEFDTSYQEKITAFNDNAAEKQNAFNQSVTNANDAFDSKVNQVNSDLDTKITSANNFIDEKVLEATNQANEAKKQAQIATDEVTKVPTLIEGKLDKNLGVENSDKILTVDDEGNIVSKSKEDLGIEAKNDNFIYKDVAKQLNPNITDSFQRAMWNLKLYGQSTQGADPSPTNPQEITAISEFEGAPTGKNLIDTTDYNSASSNGITATYNKQEDYYLLNGECIGSAALNFPLIINGKQTDYTISLIYLDGDFSIPDSEYCVAFVGKSDFKDNGNVTNWLNSENVNKNKISQGTSTLNAKYIRNFWFYVSNGVICNNLKVRVQLEEGSAVTEYESFKSQPFTYTPTNPMYSTQDGSIADYVDVENGVEVYNMSGAVVFDGSEDEIINLQSINDYGIANFYILINGTELSTKIMCSNFIQQKTVISATETEGVYPIRDQLYFRIYQETASTVEEFREWLSQNPITVVYSLETPTETPIPQEQLAMLRALYTYNGVTNFLCNGDVSFDYEQSLQIVINKIWNAIGQTNANILIGGNE